MSKGAGRAIRKRASIRIYGNDAIRPPMRLAVLCDFDGTITTRDASYAILERFGEGDWRSIEERAYTHEITILEALKLQAGMVKVGEEEASAFLRENIGMREGFREFALGCREEGIHLEICSDGFGWTIEVLLEHWGLEWIPWTSNRTVPSENGWEIHFDHRREGCPINANCKCAHYERLKRENEQVIFIGDGTTDECVSRIADVVFARDRLLELCRRSGRVCIPWSDWRELREIIMGSASNNMEG
ncbi:hypothetical protein B6U90_00110 [Thermoplasmatales archaeon ex4484_6]|nr:MAG: hypothetical protein B6U90_00110 [Thermoplasmatales archaeon ex4484_6]